VISSNAFFAHPAFLKNIKKGRATAWEF